MNILVVYCFLLTLVAASELDSLQRLNLEPIIGVPGALRKTPSTEDRITGGKPALLGQFPYQVGLKIKLKTKTAYCGGTLISNKTVLTAAHCCDNAEEILVVLGSVMILNETETSRVTMKVPWLNIHKHLLWNAKKMVNDICLLRLPKLVPNSAYIRPAILPIDDSLDYHRDGVIASGWGKDSDKGAAVSPILRFVRSTVISNPTCSAYYLGLVKEPHICMAGTGGKSTCNGDSGGPLVLEADGKTLIGITSFGVSMGCQLGWPPVFTRVSKFLGWIKDNSIL